VSCDDEVKMKGLALQRLKKPGAEVCGGMKKGLYEKA
jgi:hypothetical protein